MDKKSKGTKDRWDKAGILGNFIIAIIVATAGWIVSAQISESEQRTSSRISKVNSETLLAIAEKDRKFQEKITHENHKFQKEQTKFKSDILALQAESDRVSTLLPLLASENDLEKAMAIKVLLALKARGLFPADLDEPLLDFISDPKPEEIYPNIKITKPESSSGSLAQNSPHFKGLENEVAELFPRIYFYVLNEHQKARLKNIRKELANDKKQYKRRRVFVMSNYNIKESELRYFFESDKEEASYIQKILRSHHLNVKVKLSKSKPKTLKPRHFEVWIK